jgi:sarcosine/dimethylglycine N-methyltransferase
MSVEIRSAIDFYERHPISSEIILAKLNASRGHLNDVAPEELFPHDQDPRTAGPQKFLVGRVGKR